MTLRRVTALPGQSRSRGRFDSGLSQKGAPWCPQKHEPQFRSIWEERHPLRRAVRLREWRTPSFSVIAAGGLAGARGADGCPVGAWGRWMLEVPRQGLRPLARPADSSGRTGRGSAARPGPDSEGPGRDTHPAPCPVVAHTRQAAVTGLPPAPRYRERGASWSGGPLLSRRRTQRALPLGVERLGAPPLGKHRQQHCIVTRDSDRNEAEEDSGRRVLDTYSVQANNPEVTFSTTHRSNPRQEAGPPLGVCLVGGEGRGPLSG